MSLPFARLLAPAVLAAPALAQSLPVTVHEVERLPAGRTLITDGGVAAGQPPGVAFLVEEDGSLVHSWLARTRWTHSAEPTSDGSVIVTDTGNDRLLEIAADGSILWNSDSVSPFSDGSVLRYPNDAEPLPGGSFLVSDRENHRVIELDRDGTVLWQYGVTGVPGSGPGFLRGPHNPDRLANGHTLIADSDNDRVLEVDAAGQVVWNFHPTGPQALDWPRDADEMPDGRIVIADSRTPATIEISNGSRSRTTSATPRTTSPITCGLTANSSVSARRITA